ncbi:MAG: penicillin acylase family protein [Chitinophagales bacterium]
MRFFYFILLAGLAFIAIFYFDKGFGGLPPIGKLTDPVHGFMANAESKNNFESFQVSTGRQKVKGNVYFDERLVPHIYADNNRSLYFLQGYITAKYRLWQMDIQTRAAAGRLSEVFGAKFINYDIEQRRKGMVYAAEKSLDKMKADKEITECVEAYTDGVNEFISPTTDDHEINLSYASYPIEFKLLNYKPEKWTALKTALLLTYMSNTLTGFDDDLEYSNLLKLLGEEDFNLLYPDRPAGIDPIIPSEKKYDFIPIAPDTNKLVNTENYYEKVIDIFGKPDKNELGSNNWAVSPQKTKNGHPILCNDPHLALNLPSLWFEIQLTAPGINCYGASLPGSPAIIIGFNDSIAWGVTNGQIDVRDWYTVEFSDDSKMQYKYGDGWKQTTKRIEKIKVKGGDEVTDTVLYTHYGPLVYHGDEKNLEGETNPEIIQRANLVMRWAALDPGQELKTFYLLNRGENYNDYREALSYYSCPAQNFIFSCANGDIAITQRGKVPVKYKGEGRGVLNGSDPKNDYQTYIPLDQNPTIKNPQRGFCSSANQHPTDSTYPYYYTSYDFEYYRNRVINNELSKMENITVEDMQHLQQNNFNMMASEVLPKMLKTIEYARGEKILGPDNSDKEDAYAQLKSWDFYNNTESHAATYFQIWWDTLYNLLWDEMVDDEIALVKPNNYNTVWAINNFANDYTYFDVVSTENTEKLSAVIVQSYNAMISISDSLMKKDPELLKWYHHKNTSIMHISQIPAFSRIAIENGGYKNIVNATSQTHGPSWRMIVELSTPVNAYGVYPGGQSGNPGSKYFDNFIDDWAAGKYYKLNFYPSEAEAKKSNQFSIVFK